MQVSRKWSLSAHITFSEWYAELMKFKAKFGHCNVMQKRTGEYQSLGNWCNNLRKAYKKIRNSETPTLKLSEEHKRQLEDAGFKWSLSTVRTFGEWYEELMKFKDKFGDCNVTQRAPVEHQSIGRWCGKVRTSYKKIRNRETPTIKLTEDTIRQFEDAGFKWR